MLHFVKAYWVDVVMAALIAAAIVAIVYFFGSLAFTGRGQTSP